MYDRSMQKRIIAIDCDDVIVATAPAILDFYNTRYNTRLELKNLYSKDLTLWAADDAKTAMARVDEFLKTSEYQQMEPFKEAVGVIHELKKYHELHIVTGRNDFLQQATQDMIDRFFPDTFTSIEYTNFFTDTPRSKGDVCIQLGADLLIDDHLHHASVVAECGTDVFLFGDYPWNQSNNLPERITRVSGWHEIGKRLLP